MAVTKKQSFDTWFGTAAEKVGFTSAALGDKYFETDTQLLFEYTGAVWVTSSKDNLTLSAGTNLIGKVEIDQVTANANEVVTKTGSVSDVTLQAGTNIVGKVEIDQTTDETTNKVRSDGVTKDTYAVTELSASGVIKASGGKLYGLAGINNSASDQYLQIFASDTVPANGNVPKLVLFIPAKSNFSFDLGLYGFTLTAGITWNNSSTLDSKTIGSADVWLNAIYI